MIENGTCSRPLLPFWLVLLLFSSAHSDAAPPKPIFPFPVTPLPERAKEPAIADFDGDGFADLAVPLRDRSTVHFLKGRGYGQFEPWAVEATSGSSSVALTCDVDGGGIADLVLWSVFRIQVFLGREDGSPVRLFPQEIDGWHTEYHRSGDFNGDGLCDLAWVENQDEIVVRTGYGDASFVETLRLEAPSRVRSLLALDLDGNGFDDLVAATSVGPAVFVASESGFEASPPGPASFCCDLVSSDLDGDGFVDLVSARNYWDNVPAAWLRGRGDGTFEDPRETEGTEDFVPLAAADLDGDRFDDLVGAALDGEPGTTFRFLRGRGDGRFETAGETRNHRYTVPRAVDIDGDRHKEILLYSDFPEWILAIFGSRETVVETPRELPHPLLDAPSSLRAHDLDRDGDVDLFVAGPCCRSWTHAATGPFEFDPPVYTSVLAPENLSGPLLADFNGDGDVDVAASRSRFVEVALGRGDGRFEDPRPVFELTSGGVAALAAGDFDDDRRLDLFASFLDFHTGIAGIAWLPGDGFGGFDPAVRLVERASLAVDVAVGDLDGDGNLDLASIGPFLGLEIRLGNGDGTLGPPRTIYDPWPEWIEITDLDVDGVPDLVVVGSPDGPPGPFRVGVWRGTGGGEFERRTITEAGYWTSGTAVADFNGDTYPDIALTTYSGYIRGFGMVSVHVGDGAGGLADAGRYLADPYARGLAAGDFDGDGRPDLAVGASEWFSGPHRIRFLRNLSRPPNAPPVADAGPDQRLECASPDGTRATLDGSGSSDPDSTPGTADDIASWRWNAEALGVLEGAIVEAPFPLGEHSATLVVTDRAGESDSDACLVVVEDTTPPSGGIVAPLAGACFGPAALPVVIEDDFADLCDAAPARDYDPAGGPAYDAHGDYEVRVTATDASGNRSADTVVFTVDTVAPEVVLFEPDRSLLVPSLVGLSLRFRSSDDDGATGGVIRERILVAECPILDGATYGDRDGLLSDETILLDLATFCRAASACGWTVLESPELRLEAEDCGGNVGSASRRFPGALRARPGLCGS